MIPPPPRSTLFPYTTLFRSSSMLEEYWNRTHEPPVSSPPSQPVDASAANIKQSSSPRFGSVDMSSPQPGLLPQDRKSTRLNSSHRCISYAVFCLKKKNIVE